MAQWGSLGVEWQHSPDSWSHILSGRSQMGKMANFISSCGFFLLRPCPQPWWGWYWIDSTPALFFVTMTMTYSRSRKALQNRAVGKCIALAQGPSVSQNCAAGCPALCRMRGWGTIYVCLTHLLRHLLCFSFLCP